MSSTGSPTYDALLERLHRRPFEPFAVSKRDGTRLNVTRQFQLGTNGRIVMVAAEAGREATKVFSIAEVAQVLDIGTRAP